MRASLLAPMRNGATRSSSFETASAEEAGPLEGEGREGVLKRKAERGERTAAATTMLEENLAAPRNSPANEFDFCYFEST